jgi:6-pyruvoyl-tetrahydropterin synthase
MSIITPNGFYVLQNVHSGQYVAADASGWLYAISDIKKAITWQVLQQADGSYLFQQRGTQNELTYKGSTGACYVADEKSIDEITFNVTTVAGPVVSIMNIYHQQYLYVDGNKSLYITHNGSPDYANALWILTQVS